VRNRGHEEQDKPHDANRRKPICHDRFTTNPAHAPHAALMIDFDNVTMGIRRIQSELRGLLQSDIIKEKWPVQRGLRRLASLSAYIVPLAESSIDRSGRRRTGRTRKRDGTSARGGRLELVFTRPEIGTFILLSAIRISPRGAKAQGVRQVRDRRGISE